MSRQTGPLLVITSMLFRGLCKDRAAPSGAALSYEPFIDPENPETKDSRAGHHNNDQVAHVPTSNNRPIHVRRYAVKKHPDHPYAGYKKRDTPPFFNTPAIDGIFGYLSRPAKCYTVSRSRHDNPYQSSDDG